MPTIAWSWAKVLPAAKAEDKSTTAIKDLLLNMSFLLSLPAIRAEPGWDGAARSFARVMVTLLLDHLYDRAEIVACRVLHGRELLIGFELPQPQHLADWQDVPVVDIGVARGGQGTADAQQGLRVFADRDLEGITLDVGDLRPGIGGGSGQPAARAGPHHGVVELPVLVAHGRRLGSRIVEERVACGVGLAFEVVALIDAVERRLDDAGVLA